MGVVKGIVFDESVLFAEDNNGNIFFQSGAETLLGRLLYSKLRTNTVVGQKQFTQQQIGDPNFDAIPCLINLQDSGLKQKETIAKFFGISYGVGVSKQKVTFLKKMAMLYSIDCFLLNVSSFEDSLNEILVAWGDIGGSCLYVASVIEKDLFTKLGSHGWLIVVKSDNGGVTMEYSELLFIEKLENLPFTLCHLNRKATRGGVVTVGYVMKPSREEDFAKRGAFPMYPTHNGLMFLPFTLDAPIASQVQEVDVVLHKATDEIATVKLSSSSESSSRIIYSKGMQDLERYFQDHPDCCVIDPLDNIYPVLDRLRIQHILLGLEDLNVEGRCRIRGPHFLKVDSFNNPNLAESLSEAKLLLPTIVKPQVACGVAEAHSMAIVFRSEDFKDLHVPLPAIIQEYVDHSSLLFKFYVLGEKVFHTVKKSTPNADVFLSSYEEEGLKPIMFDSLKSLPTAKDQHSRGSVRTKVNEQSLDLELVTDAANWLRVTLDLTIFGFDVVIQEGTRDHVIVDVNYLPSFKEVSNDIAIPAFWDAIKKSFESRSQSRFVATASFV